MQYRRRLALALLLVACRDSSPPAPARLALTAGPADAARSRVTLETQPVVQLQDAHGRAVGRASVLVTASVVAGDATLLGATSVMTDRNGRATFADLAIAGKVGTVTLSFASPGLDATTADVTVSAGDAAQLALVEGDHQTATVASPLPLAPAVKVSDADGNPVSQVSVSFAVVGGNGSVNSSSASTGTDGVARVTWTLGTVAGANTLTASANGLAGSPVTLTATGVAGAPAKLVLLAGDNQSAPARTMVASPITLSVRDQFDNPVKTGVSVTFVVPADGGGGDVAAGTATSDGDGTVTSPAWRLGKSAVPQKLTAILGAVGAPGTVDVSATVQTSYHIDIRFFGTPMSQANQDLFTNAAHRLEGIVTGDVLDVQVTNLDLTVCGVTDPSQLTGAIDDVIIYASVGPIDGPGQILAQAGPCYVRDAAPAGQAQLLMPVIGVMQFDDADLATLAGAGNLQDVITHEMLHVVGVGTMWEDRGELAGKGTSDPRFTGALATQGCIAVGGTTSCASSVPVEGTGGAGTVDSHWRETTFDNELMTGYLDAGANPISQVTVRSLGDLGYVVNNADFDAYSIAIGSLRASGPVSSLFGGTWEQTRARDSVHVLPVRPRSR